MIKKQRLEELIEQGATVCNAYKDWDNVWHCRFGNVVQEENHLLFKENGSSLSVIMHNTNNLYETKEQAEWEWEFSCIERTQYLVLPTWEEIKHDFIDNIKKSGSYPIVEFKDLEVGMEVYDGCGLFKGKKGTYITIYGDDNYVYELTKENYTLACRKAKELFLGENNDKENS